MKFLNKWLPSLWGMLWIFIITGTSIALAILIIKWIINLIGVGV